jgi:DNA-binding NarL/FixJ family response regulator
VLRLIRAISVMRPRLLIADDHSVVAEGLRSLLEKSYDVVSVVHDGQELLAEGIPAQT